jgi:hypothetical protein
MIVNSMVGGSKQDAHEEGRIRRNAKLIVDPNTTEERRKRARDNLERACFRYANRHSMNPTTLYWLAIAKAGTQREEPGPNESTLG